MSVRIWERGGCKQLLGDVYVEIGVYVWHMQVLGMCIHVWGCMGSACICGICRYWGSCVVYVGIGLYVVYAGMGVYEHWCGACRYWGRCVG